MTQKTQHTPTPYKFMSNGGDLYIYAMKDGFTTYIAKCPADSDEKVLTMEYLIKAANSHDALVEALEIAIGYVALVADGQKEIPITQNRAKSDSQILGAALAQAKGE